VIGEPSSLSQSSFEPSPPVFCADLRGQPGAEGSLKPLDVSAVDERWLIALLGKPKPGFHRRLLRTSNDSM